MTRESERKISRRRNWDEIKKELFQNPAISRDWDTYCLAVEIGSAVQEVRNRAGLTQAGLAQKLGVCQSLIARLESENPERLPSLGTVARVLQACGFGFKISISPDLGSESATATSDEGQLEIGTGPRTTTEAAVEPGRSGPRRFIQLTS